MLCRARLKQTNFLFFNLMRSSVLGLAQRLQLYDIHPLSGIDKGDLNTSKKTICKKMAIKFVEFDQNDEPIYENPTPLGLYLHNMKPVRMNVK